MLISENQSFEQKPQTGPTEDLVVRRRAKGLKALTILVSVPSGVGTAGMVFLYLTQMEWQFAVLAILYASTFLFSGLTTFIFLPRRRLTKQSIMILGVLLGLSQIFTSAFIADVGLPGAAIFLVFSLIASASVETDVEANGATINGILGAGIAALLTEHSPFIQLVVEPMQIAIAAALGVLLIGYAVMLVTRTINATLRIRLVTSFIALVVVPLTILSAIQAQYMFSVLNDQVNQALELAAQQTALGIDTFLSRTERSVIETSGLNVFVRYLETSEQQRSGSAVEEEMEMTLRVLDASELNSSTYLSSYALLDMDGYVMYDTLSDRLDKWLNPEAVRALGLDVDSLITRTGGFEGDQDYFLVPARSFISYKSPIQINNSTKGFFYVSAPIKNKEGETIGVLRARYDGLVLQDLLKQYNGLMGPKSYAILLDENNIRLADAFTPNYLYKAVAPLPDDLIKTLRDNRRLPDLPKNMLSTGLEEFDQILQDPDKNKFFRTTYSLAYGDTEHSEIGAIVKTRSMPWKVVYLNTDFSEEGIRQEQQKRTILATTLIAAMVGLIAMVAARLLSSPIAQLTKTAQKISEGDLTAQAPAQALDEFGSLGRSFNLMTAQLRGLIGQLEERVKARTEEIENQNEVLSHRATQLQTISEVARQIVSAQELEMLLSTITGLISERFGFYHVGIFLLDENREYAILRAANSKGGQRMLARNHKLLVGKVGIVGHATGTGEARIATDVGVDAVYFNNPDLPETRSEMALPLKVGDEIIGALDVQSTESNAFQPDEIELFTTMADQVAIAIYNNQLYMETRRALDEAQLLHRQYLRGEWAQDTTRRKVMGYLYNNRGVTSQQTEHPLWQEVFETGEPILTAQESQENTPGKAIMAMPIAIRGETIGVIHVQDQGEERGWSEDEIAVVNSIANQVAVALENARLFENTVRRADREKKVVEITAKIRSTNDPEEMMRIAVSELQQALRATRTQIYIRQSGENVDKSS